VPQTLNAHVVDEWIRVSDKESFLSARRLARFEGLLVGGSSGAALAAALQYGRRLGPDDMIVTVFADGGHSYLSRMYDDEWLIEQGYLESPARTQTAGNVLEIRGPSPVISVAPDDPAETAIQRLREHDISQMPVIDNGKLVGSVREITVARLLHDRRDPNEIPVREIMARPLPQVEFNTDVSEVYRVLMSGHSGVMVTRGGAIEGIITRIDLVGFWEATRSAASSS
jgi:cystathionine beta-synthase